MRRDRAFAEVLPDGAGGWLVRPFHWPDTGPCPRARQMLIDALGEGFFDGPPPASLSVSLHAELVEALAMRGEGGMCLSVTRGRDSAPRRLLPMRLARVGGSDAWALDLDREMVDFVREGVVDRGEVARLDRQLKGPGGEELSAVMGFASFLSFASDYAGSTVVDVQPRIGSGPEHPHWAGVAARFERVFPVPDPQPGVVVATERFLDGGGPVH